MLNWIWAAFFFVAFAAAIAQAAFGGNPDALRAVVASLFDSSKAGFEIALGLTGVMTLWLGLKREDLVKPVKKKDDTEVELP